MKNRLNFCAKTSLMITSLLVSVSALAVNQWPDLPVGLKSGVSAQTGDKLFVGLGSAGKEFYMLDLNNVDKGWQKKASFDGPARSGATASVIDNEIYIFGGSGKIQESDAAPVLFDTIYRYNVKSDAWAQVNSASPVGLLGASSYSPDGKNIVFFGGYNKGYFDQYLSDVMTTDKNKEPEKWQKIVDDYMGMKPSGYKWNRSVLTFKPETGKWVDLGMSPYLPNCGSALITDGKQATIISGEIKPGLRTAEVKQYQYGQPQPWQSLHSLPAPSGSPVQEGVAGAFAGESNGAFIVAGGANFHGAKGAFESGKMFAHNGFGKAFNPEMYVLKDGLWAQVNNLPAGLAYGASFTTNDGVLIVGGEDGARKASKTAYLLSWDGKDVTIQD
ncbi:N-acetylneuraminate epimerase [Vibrio sp. DW001]|uniref:N-acetylneuraminate epimerase n=1 Tax=Vibrio sp. DW001 TaxID=2912315 RepID=UPI0023AF174D|nr:N-acetylneuraminate epimerase [Vibrio sp. DW001]WED29521.1 N-acetylneuraminate epimerase [Vibrio sp. DW001]